MRLNTPKVNQINHLLSFMGVNNSGSPQDLMIVIFI